jgi:NAD+ diphosphatase
MINEVFPHTFDNRFVVISKIEDDDYVLYYNKNTLLLKPIDAGFEIPRKRDFTNITDKTEKTFLFTLNNISCFLIWDMQMPDHDGFVYKETSYFRTFEQREIAWICVLGFQLKTWYSQNKFCGNCGSKTKEKADERAIECANCNTIVYPKISPAIIVAIVSNDKLLLARNTNFPDNWYSIIAGYADIGESLE